MDPTRAVTVEPPASPRRGSSTGSAFGSLTGNYSPSGRRRSKKGGGDGSVTTANTAPCHRAAVQIRGELDSHQQGHVNTVAELNRLHAVPNAALADLDQEVGASITSNRTAEVARMRLSVLRDSLQSSEEMVDALGQRVLEIQDRLQAIDQDREDLCLRYEAACRERDVARRQLSIVPTVIGTLADMSGGHSAQDPANQRGDINDDGCHVSEDRDEDRDSASEEERQAGELDPAPKGRMRRPPTWLTSSSRPKR
ncbi:unnamed protein product [Phytophthora fragariaefolia]|uniref:Unnamed protein product n=1 Tax=Phytophthora fragariaefolia TaxID=1490495 RepID=A0A9W6XB23_9STRA|nr:unnamed protein product [Phytophthora fragariaefolia]